MRETSGRTTRLVSIENIDTAPLRHSAAFSEGSSSGVGNILRDS